MIVKIVQVGEINAVIIIESWLESAGNAFYGNHAFGNAFAIEMGHLNDATGPGVAAEAVAVAVRSSRLCIW